ncbi:uncharacterized protein DNG_07515 [Cephalotrichum gorgonifer]|uniref:Uncharacterized protein n=1 Tax=Cephalotrichum gorgonifer TaxID=2041049 RepID=A0AAE8SXH3_9PEZI|nr:uncharacterized protein DNG_07515 [Cephalotrichum gorgonifer]
MALRLLTLAALLSTSALAKTDLEGCTSSDGVHTVTGRNDIQPYFTRIWYVPETGEICEILDCGGGRAPPKTNVPGCGNYKGTETYSPKFLPSSTSSVAAPESTADDAEATDSATGTASGTGSQITPAPSGAGNADASGTEEDGPEESGDEGSGAAAMGVSVMGGLAVIGAAAWGLF